MVALQGWYRVPLKGSIRGRPGYYKGLGFRDQGFIGFKDKGNSVSGLGFRL